MSGTILAWIAFGIIVGASTLWFRAMQQVRIPADRTAYLLAWAGGALLGVVAIINEPTGLGLILGPLAVIAGGFFTFTFLISRQVVAENAVSVGDGLPDFSAPDEHGGTFERESLSGHPVLIKFFRGHW